MAFSKGILVRVMTWLRISYGGASAYLFLYIHISRLLFVLYLLHMSPLNAVARPRIGLMPLNEIKDDATKLIRGLQLEGRGSYA